MPTILLKKSDTPGSVPGTANLTNLAGGVEVAVNTADKRMFSMTSASAVIELGTNPSSLTCANASLTNITGNSATITNLTQPKFTSYRETVVTNATASGTISLDLSQGNVFNLTLTSSGSLVISNPPSSGTSFSFTVICLQGTGGSKTLTYPASVKFTDGVTPVLTTTAGKYDVLTFFTVDGGTTYFGAYAMANL